mmetsp:Transcript_33109/g.53570  ORF Transcript_33109/g.53570 Transcript_33109/m.53570 type:complete len:89 (+) Transcript_33109:270-536(+)
MIKLHASTEGKKKVYYGRRSIPRRLAPRKKKNALSSPIQKHYYVQNKPTILKNKRGILFFFLRFVQFHLLFPTYRRSKIGTAIIREAI